MSVLFGSAIPRAYEQAIALHGLTEKQFDKPYTLACSDRLMDTMRRWFGGKGLKRATLNAIPLRFSTRHADDLMPIFVEPMYQRVVKSGVFWAQNPDWVYARYEIVVWQQLNGEVFWTAVKLPKPQEIAA